MTVIPEESEHPFAKLKPDFVMDAIESVGYLCDGRMFPLNSYENRVYQIGIEAEQPLIAKFYRPERWSREQILEEHQFCFELMEQELPVVAPLRHDNGESLLEYQGFYLALFPQCLKILSDFQSILYFLLLFTFLTRLNI